jgi:hypothetical protein
LGIFRLERNTAATAIGLPMHCHQSSNDGGNLLHGRAIGDVQQQG